MTAEDQGAHPEAITVAAVQASIRFFSRPDRFREEMATHVRDAMRCSPDLIVLPEDVGTGLVALGTDYARSASSIGQAIVAVAIRNLGGAVPRLLHPSFSVPRALLLTMAERMREVYEGAFSDLAAQHRVFIAAGSVLLPHPAADDGHVYNTFYLFGPDGRVLHTADKVNLIDLENEEGLDLSPGERQALTVWPTQIGAFAPLICYDAWDADLAARLVADGAQMLLVPSANPEPWTPQVLAERREGMYARVRELGVPGVEPFAVGSLAGLDFEGRSWILAPDPDEPAGVRTLARAETATEPEIICATVELPRPANAASAPGDAGGAR